MKLYYVDENDFIIGDSEAPPDFSKWKPMYTSEVFEKKVLTKVLMHCRKYTKEELNSIKKQKEIDENNELLKDLPNAVADLSFDVSENYTTLSDISDAIADLSNIVSDLSVKVDSNG